MKQANAPDIFLEIRSRNRNCNLDELFAKRSRDGLTMPFFGAMPNGIFLFRRLLNKRLKNTVWQEIFAFSNFCDFSSDP